MGRRLRVVYLPISAFTIRAIFAATSRKSIEQLLLKGSAPILSIPRELSVTSRLRLPVEI